MATTITSSNTLPGAQRRVQTAVSEYQRSRRQWQSIRDECFTALTALSNTAIQLGFVDHEACWHPSLAPFSQLKALYTRRMTVQLESDRARVDTLLEKLERQWRRMSEQINDLQQLQTLLQTRLGEERVRTTPVLATLTLSTLVERLAAVAKEHAAQLAMDRRVVTMTGGVRTRDAATLQLTSWLNAPAMDMSGQVAALDDLLLLEMQL